MQDIDSALMQAVAGLNLAVPIAYPNQPKPFSPPSSGAFVAVVNVPVTDNAVTLGDSGEDEITGYLQFNVSDQTGAGTANIAKLRGAIRAGMKIGNKAEYNGQIVTYTFRKHSPILPNGAYVTGVIQVYWRARTQRSN